MRSIKRKIYFKLVVFGLVALGPIAAHGADKNVLLFSATDPHLPAIKIIDEAIRSKFAGSSIGRVKFFTEALEHSRIPTEKYEAEIVSYLQKKYAGEQFDCIFALGSLSLGFLTKHQSELFGDTPVVFVAQDEREVSRFPYGKNTTGTMGRLQLSPNLELMLAQHPGTRTVVVVSGNSEVDRFWRAQAENEFAAYAGRVEFKYVTNLTVEELRAELASLPKDHLVYFLAFLLDRDGKTFSYPESVALVAPTASVPLYGTADTGMGAGIIGGNLFSFEALGQGAADIGLRIIAGEKPSDIPAVVMAGRTMFDWRELQRWNVDETRLPAGSIVRFRQPTFWEQYRVYVAAALAVMLLQAMLIILLLVTRVRQQKAETERNEFQALAAAEHERLDEVVTNVPGIVWESRVVGEDGRRQAQFVSGYVEEMLGYSVEECLADPDFIASKVVEEDREAYRHEANAVFTTREPKTVQYRCVTKDGGWKWAESRMIAVGDASGKSVGLRGVTMDITDRKAAEDLARESEGRFRDMADASPALIWIANTEADITYANKTLLEFTGRPEEELLGEGWLNIVHDDDRERCIETYMIGFDNKEPFVLDYRLLRADGEYRWLLDTGAPRFSLSGEFLGYIGSAMDITERKAADEVVRESEARFRNIADTAPVLIWMSDVSPLITFVNKFGLDFTGRSQEELSGERWLESIHEDDRQRTIDIYTDAYSRREPFSYEYRIRRGDGTYHWFYSTSAPRLSVAGEFLGYIGTCVDIHDRKKAEESLQLALVQINQLKNELHEENIYLKEEIKLIHNFDEIIGESEPLKYVLFKIEQVAPTNATVMIAGETGTGKELVARAVHSASLRKDKPLVKVNCAALAANFIESELFGHERGSFTGASAKRIGRFELAHGGTIFLDEIGELPMDLQVKLLRILQEGEFERLGSSKTIKVDVRVIAATNRDLREEVRKGNFREDLLFRLNVFPITVPPLRDRADDIPRLVNYFAHRFSKQLGKNVSSVAPSALRTLTGHSWPGNVRELANVIERSVIGTNGDTLKFVEAFETPTASNGPAPSADTLDGMERKYIVDILGSTGWRIEGDSGAARILGINPSTLRTRMNKLGISRKSDRATG